MNHPRSSSSPHSQGINEDFTVANIIRYINWTSEDFKNVSFIRQEVKKNILPIMDNFYAKVLDNPVAASILKKSKTTVDSLKKTLSEWILDIVENNLDENTFQKQQRIGIRHVQIQLPQAYMVLGINVIRSELRKIILELCERELKSSSEILNSLDKALDARLAIMLRSYQTDREKLLKEKVLAENENLMAMGRMSASIAHEVKNPLAAINGAVEVLKGKLPAHHPDLEIMDSIIEQVKRLSSTVKDLLDFARPVKLNHQTIELKEIIDSVQTLLKNDPTFKLAIVYANPEAAHLKIDVDPVRMQNVFYNLFVNSSEAAGATKIAISSQTHDDTYTLLIEDDGSGVPPTYQENLFRPFASNKSHGTGLGLAICAKIIESHGGLIDYFPYAPGACFRIHLPKEAKK